MHLNAPFRVVPKRLVLKLAQLEVAAQLAIDSPPQVQVERRGYACRIVVCQEHAALRFHQVGAYQERVARLEATPQIAQKFEGAGPLEIADCAAEKKYEKCFLRPAMGDRAGHAVQIELLQRIYFRHLGQLAFATRERVG